MWTQGSDIADKLFVINTQLTVSYIAYKQVTCSSMPLKLAFILYSLWLFLSSGWIKHIIIVFKAWVWKHSFVSVDLAVNKYLVVQAWQWKRYMWVLLIPLSFVLLVRWLMWNILLQLIYSGANLYWFSIWITEAVSK